MPPINCSGNAAQLSYEQHPHFVDFAPLADELRIRLNNWFCRVPEASDKKNPGAGRNVRHLCFIVGDVAGHPLMRFFKNPIFEVVPIRGEPGQNT